MLVGLDSEFAPSAATADAAKAGGVTIWSGYLATRSNVGIANAWTQADFENARRCGGIPIGYCSGWDDPAAVKALAAAWNVRACLDVESGIRGDGTWVQAWLDTSGAGLYGNYGVHPSRRATFHVMAGYPGYDPKATWPSDQPRPTTPCAWQFQGTHTEFGVGVDRSWLDDWFNQGDDIMTAGEKIALVQMAFAIVRPDRQPDYNSEVLPHAALIKDDGSNAHTIIGGMLYSPEGLQTEQRVGAILAAGPAQPPVPGPAGPAGPPGTAQPFIAQITPK